MEQKNLKTSVFSLDTVFCESGEQPIDIDFTLPDYYADITKILKCRTVSRVASKSINGNQVIIEGSVTITVIYCGSDNSVNSYEYQYPFSKNFDTQINTDGCILNAKTKCEYINCRAVTGRKIDIHGAVGIYVTLVRRRLTDVVSDCDNCGIETLRGNVPATIPMGSADKYLIIDEEIELGDAQPDIRCLIRYDAVATITDSKILAGKSVVKGEMTVKLLYCPENGGSPQTVQYQLPFSQLIEIDGITDQCDCESRVEIAHLEIKPRVAASGECRQLMLSAKLLITSECCCNNDVSVILDAYSRKYEADIFKNDVCFNKISENLNKDFICKKNIEFPEGALSAVTDIWCDVCTNSVKFCDNAMQVNGIATVFIIGQDGDRIPVFYEKTLDFEYVHPMVTDGNYKSAPEITAKGISYTINSDCNMELRVELNICGAIYKCSILPLVTDIKINDNMPVKREKRGAMTIYFATSGERIWDIARNYFSNVDEIKQINDINEDVLTEDKMILISTC